MLLWPHRLRSRCKSEYAEARNVHIQLLHEVSVEDDAYVHAWSLLYIAEIEMCMGAQQHDVQKNIDRAKSISSFGGDLRPLQWCTILCITLTLKDAHMSSARTLLQKALEFSWGKKVHLIAYCLERLCEVSCRNVSDCTSIWATVFLAHSIKFKSRLGINKALQFIANVSPLHGNEDTALSLYTVALDGFTHMDVHQSRVECMLCLGPSLQLSRSRLHPLELANGKKKTICRGFSRERTWKEWNGRQERSR
jgi:hypothetical protein